MIANSYNNISCTYARIDDYVKAADYAQKALTILEANYPPDHPSIAIVRRNLEHYKLKIG